MSAIPARYDLSAYRGDSWSQGFRFLRNAVPVDLTGAAVKAKARALNSTITALVVAIENPTDGRIRLTLPATLPAATYDYDIEVTDGGVVATWVHGALFVISDVA